MFRLLRTAVYTLIFAGLALAGIGLAGSLGGLRLEQHAQAAPGATKSPQMLSAYGVPRDALARASAGIPLSLAPTLAPASTPAPTQTPDAQATVPAEPATPTPTAQDALLLRLTPVSEPTPLPPAPPDWLVIPRIAVYAPVVLSPAVETEVMGTMYTEWAAPETAAAGWHEGSALLGEPGNTVLNGHHNILGKVFARLSELEPGDAIQVRSGEQTYAYVVTQVMLFEERGLPLAQRAENARWLLPSADERLTLVTCWPPENNTHRLIVVARPLD